MHRRFTAILGVALILSSPPADSRTSTQDTTSYIHNAWATLTRSMSECRSFRDVKIQGRPILYVPHGTPREALTGRLAPCRVKVVELPKVIHAIGDIDVNTISEQGLLYLPNPYVVPGGMFNEMYGWDSYFIIRGLLADGLKDLARGMVENFFFEIEHYGGVLNANRTYYLTRSQPPFLTSMIRAVYESGKADPHWLVRAYRLAAQDHALWLRPEHQAGDTGLARYYDYGSGPVPEMEANDNYYATVAQYALLHPEAAPYLSSGTSDKDGQIFMVTTCRVSARHACSEAMPVRFNHDYYKADRAMRESGFDVSFRFGAYGGRTHHFAPVCLNALLYKEEQDLAWMAKQLDTGKEEKHWSEEAAARQHNIDKYLWNASTSAYFDYDLEARKQSTYLYASIFYPLWASAADRTKATGVRGKLPQFLKSGGVVMSAFDSGAQWDSPYGWAPIQLLATEGLDGYGFHADAQNIARAFDSMVDENFIREGTIREKYDVVSRSTETKISAGYRENVVGFGWTNGVYLLLKSRLQKVR